MFGLPTALQQTNDLELKQIMQQIVVLQNGVVASKMAKSGVRGNMNYGVSIIDIKRIALQYGTNHSLAARLCALKIREAKILASLLFDAQTFTNSEFDMVFESISNIELAECFAQNLLWNIDNLLFWKQLFSGDKWQKVAAIYAVGWVFTKKTSNSELVFNLFKENLSDILAQQITEIRKPLLSTLSTIAQNGVYNQYVAEVIGQFAVSANEFERDLATQYQWFYADNFAK